MTALPTREFKRGTTFALGCIAREDGVARDITSDTITCHVREVDSDTLIGSCTVTKTSAVDGEFACVIAAGSTASWNLVPHYCDIRYAVGSVVTKTETIRFRVVIDATRS